MIHRDIGVLDGPVLLFGGPYSNLQATRAVLDRAQARGIEASHSICTGDVVAYCADPVATVDLIRRTGCTVVAGNCEKQLAAGALDCGCGFEDGSTCDLLSAGWYAYANRTVPDSDRAWMALCPDIVTFAHAGRRYAVIHGGLTDISRFIWSVSAEAAFDAEIAAVEAAVGPVDAVIAGHSGIAFERQIGRHAWINAGVIGMPANDGGALTEYAVLDAGAVTFHKLEYDAQAASQAMEAAGLVQGYDRALLSGVWPSQDVLPAALAR